MSSRLEYSIVDVFTDVPFAGNPLAVVLGAEALSTAQLQTLARQFQLSETAFPLAATPDEIARGVGYRLRIFTTTAELPFAGHPSVGSAWVMARLGRVQPGPIVQVCLEGELPLTVAPDGGPVELTGGRPFVSAPIDPAPLLEAIGLVDADQPAGSPPPRLAGMGLDFAYLPVHPDALDRARPDLAALRRLEPGAVAGPIGVYALAWDAAARTAHARMFSDDVAGGEDPATGSAALGLGVWLIESGLLPADGPSAYTVRQGVEMGRPSTLRCTVEAVGGAVVVARVSGAVAAVAQGWIEIPPA